MSSRLAKRVVGVLVVVIGAASVLFLYPGSLAEATRASEPTSLAEATVGPDPTASAVVPTDPPEALQTSSPSPLPLAALTPVPSAALTPVPSAASPRRLRPRHPDAAPEAAGARRRQRSSIGGHDLPV